MVAVRIVEAGERAAEQDLAVRLGCHNVHCVIRPRAWIEAAIQMPVRLEPSDSAVDHSIHAGELAPKDHLQTRLHRHRKDRVIGAQTRIELVVDVARIFVIDDVDRRQAQCPESHARAWNCRPRDDGIGQIDAETLRPFSDRVIDDGDGNRLVGFAFAEFGLAAPIRKQDKRIGPEIEFAGFRQVIDHVGRAAVGRGVVDGDGMDGAPDPPHFESHHAGILVHADRRSGEFQLALVVHDYELGGSVRADGGIGAGVAQQQVHRLIPVQQEIIADRNQDREIRHPRGKGQSVGHRQVIQIGNGAAANGHEVHRRGEVGQSGAMDGDGGIGDILINLKTRGREIERRIVIENEQSRSVLSAQRNGAGDIGQAQADGLRQFHQRIVGDGDGDVSENFARGEAQSAVGRGEIRAAQRRAIARDVIDRDRQIGVAGALHRNDRVGGPFTHLVTRRSELNGSVVVHDDRRGAGRPEFQPRGVLQCDYHRFRVLFRRIIDGSDQKIDRVGARGDGDGIAQWQIVAPAGRCARHAKANGERFGRAAATPRNSEDSGLRSRFISEGGGRLDVDPRCAHINDREGMRSVIGQVGVGRDLGQVGANHHGHGVSDVVGVIARGREEGDRERFVPRHLRVVEQGDFDKLDLRERFSEVREARHVRRNVVRELDLRGPDERVIDSLDGRARGDSVIHHHRRAIGGGVGADEDRQASFAAVLPPARTLAHKADGRKVEGIIILDDHDPGGGPTQVIIRSADQLDEDRLILVDSFAGRDRAPNQEEHIIVFLERILNGRDGDPRAAGAGRNHDVRSNRRVIRIFHGGAPNLEVDHEALIGIGAGSPDGKHSGGARLVGRACRYFQGDLRQNIPNGHGGPPEPDDVIRGAVRNEHGDQLGSG